MPKKLLCPVDFSSTSDAALDLAARMAAALGASLTVVNVVAPLGWAPDVTIGLGELSQAVHRATTEGMETRRKRAQALAPGVAIETVVREGSPWAEITDLAEAQGHDTIVMATQGRSGLARVLVGSVAEQVVRHATCATLVVREAPERHLFTKIVCAIDFSAGARAAMFHAVDLAKSLGASLTLLYVQTNPTLFVDDAAAEDVLAHEAREAKRQLTEWRGDAAGRLGADVAARYEQGPSWNTIVDEGRKGGFDLIVVGTRGLTGLERAILGSVAERVVRHAASSVLVVPARGG